MSTCKDLTRVKENDHLNGLNYKNSKEGGVENFYKR